MFCQASEGLVMVEGGFFAAWLASSWLGQLRRCGRSFARTGNFDDMELQFSRATLAGARFRADRHTRGLVAGPSC